MSSSPDIFESLRLGDLDLLIRPLELPGNSPSRVRARLG